MSNIRMISSVYGAIEEVLVVFPGYKNECSSEEYQSIRSYFDLRGSCVYEFFREKPEGKLAVESPPSVLRDGGPGKQYRGPLRGMSRSQPALRGIGLSIESEKTRICREVVGISPKINLLSMFVDWQQEIDQISKEGSHFLTFDRWCQDPFVMASDGQYKIIIQSLRQQKASDFFLPLTLSSDIKAKGKGRLLIQPTELYLEGGNILKGKDKIYVGRDLIEKNIEIRKEFHPKIDSEQVIRELSEELAGEIVIVGNSHASSPLKLRAGGGGPKNDRAVYQPLFHIDLFLTLGGHREDGREIVFLGSPELGKSILSQQGIYQDRFAIPDTAMFEGIHKLFPTSQYEVHFLPLFFWQGSTFSWNNALIEVYGDTRRVILPSFQVKGSDDAQLNPCFEFLEEEVKRIYAAAGFEVEWLRDGRFFRLLAEHGGGLHCVTKVLERQMTAQQR